MVKNVLKMYGSGCIWMYLGRICAYLRCIWVYLNLSGCIWGESGMYPKISTGVQIGWKSRKTGSHIFCIFTSLYGRFRLSHALQTVDLEEIYRLVSKILHFMACGSVLGRFGVFARCILEILSKFYWNSIEILQEIQKRFNNEPYAMKSRIFGTNR